MPADPAATKTDDVATTTIGAYRLAGIVGHGGTSTVYLAHPGGDPTVSVAVKLAHPEHAADPLLSRQFAAHARVSAALRHPGVLPVVDAGVHRSRPYLVLPLVDGADLGQHLRAGGLDLARLLELLGQVAGGLDALHAGGILHLDVKPANVLVGRLDGELPADRAQLTDLGLCRFVADGPAAHRPRFDGDFTGSPRFASPEHLRGRAVGPASDVYSLACVLFAALAGRPPYTGGIPAVVTGHLSGRVPSLSALTALPSALDRVIRQGMHPDPGSRYGTCGALLAGATRALAA